MREVTGWTCEESQTKTITFGRLRLARALVVSGMVQTSSTLTYRCTACGNKDVLGSHIGACAVQVIHLTQNEQHCLGSQHQIQCPHKNPHLTRSNSEVPSTIVHLSTRWLSPSVYCRKSSDSAVMHREVAPPVSATRQQKVHTRVFYAQEALVACARQYSSCDSPHDCLCLRQSCCASSLDQPAPSHWRVPAFHHVAPSLCEHPPKNQILAAWSLQHHSAFSRRSH